MIPAEAVEEIVSDMQKGWTVVIEAPTRSKALEIFDALDSRFEDFAGTATSRVNGREGISTSSGGRLLLSVHDSPVRITLR